MSPTGRYIALVVALVTAGCSSMGGQLGTLRTQNRSLLEQNNAQLAEIENLKTHARQLADKLRNAEDELAALEDNQEPARRQLITDRRPAAAPIDRSADKDDADTISDGAPRNRRR